MAKQKQVRNSKDVREQGAVVSTYNATIKAWGRAYMMEDGTLWVPTGSLWACRAEADVFPPTSWWKDDGAKYVQALRKALKG